MNLVSRTLGYVVWGSGFLKDQLSEARVWGFGFAVLILEIGDLKL